MDVVRRARRLRPADEYAREQGTRLPPMWAGQVGYAWFPPLERRRRIAEQTECWRFVARVHEWLRHRLCALSLAIGVGRELLAGRLSGPAGTALAVVEARYGGDSREYLYVRASAAILDARCPSCCAGAQREFYRDWAGDLERAIIGERCEVARRAKQEQILRLRLRGISMCAIAAARGRRHGWASHEIASLDALWTPEGAGSVAIHWCSTCGLPYSAYPRPARDAT